ncbi:MAG: hypothetical protein Q9221_003011 [Calogaya cf. arnoldii]
MAFHRLLDLPLELRQQIYTFYFGFLPLTYPDLLPLLFSSHQLNIEASTIWRLSWPKAQLEFRVLCDLLNFLSSISHSTLCKIRHICLATNHPFRPRLGSPGIVQRILPLFPGLQLSTLTIDDPFHGPSPAYGTNQSLVYSQGWKELIYFIPRSRSLNSSSWHYQLCRPRTWDTLIKRRDGIHSGAGVQLFGYDKAKRRTRFPLASSTDDKQTSDGYQRYDQVEIRITRGWDAEYVQQSGNSKPFLENMFGQYIMRGQR